MIERVVPLAQVLDRLDHAADLVVGVGHVAGVDLGLAGEHLLVFLAERVPLRHAVRPRGQLRVRRNDAEALLVGEDPLALLVPAVVELALELLDPFLGRVVRRVRRAGRVVDEERLVRGDGVQAMHVVDRLVGHRGDEVPARVAFVGGDQRRVLREVRLPLVRVAAEEAVEVLEAHADRPLVERPGLGVHPARDVVVLAEPGGAVAVVSQNCADRRGVLLDDRVVAREAGCSFGDDAEMDRVMVAAGDERGARRRAQRRRVEVRVPQPLAGELVHVRRRNRSAEGALGAVAGVVEQDEQHVGRALGRHRPRRPPGLRLGGGPVDQPAERRGRRRQRASGHRRRVGRRAGLHRSRLPADPDGHEDGREHGRGDAGDDHHGQNEFAFHDLHSELRLAVFIRRCSSAGVSFGRSSESVSFASRPLKRNGTW